MVPSNICDNGEAIVLVKFTLRVVEISVGFTVEMMGDRLADRLPDEYTSLVQIHIVGALRYHGLYELGELPPGQLSCAGIVQTNLEQFTPLPP